VKLRIAVIPSELTQVPAIQGTEARELEPQQRTPLERKIPRCGRITSSCLLDPLL